MIINNKYINDCNIQNSKNCNNKKFKKKIECKPLNDDSIDIKISNNFKNEYTDENTILLNKNLEDISWIKIYSSKDTNLHLISDKLHNNKNTNNIKWKNRFWINTGRHKN